MGDGRAEGLSATREEGQAAVSLIPDVDGTHSGSLLFYLPSLKKKKKYSDFWVVSLFFLPLISQ